MQFAELSMYDLLEVEGGGLLDFMGDIYSGWCSMWKDFGKSIYYATH